MSCIPFGTVIMDFFTFLLEAIFYYSELVNWKHPQARYSDYITPGDRTPIAGVKTIITVVSHDKILVFAQNGIYKTVNRPAKTISNFVNNQIIFVGNVRLHTGAADQEGLGEEIADYKYRD